MPLGESQVDDDSNLIGLETKFKSQMSQVVQFNTTSTIGGYDFVVAPLLSPDYRPSIWQHLCFGSFDENVPVVETYMNMTAQLWNTWVIGKVSTWIDLDSEDETLRKDSEIVLEKELRLAAYLCLQACILPPPKGTSYINYARCVNQILGSIEQSKMELWLRIPVGKTENDNSLVDHWKTWNSFRVLCDLHSQLGVALDNLGIQPSDKSLERWHGEPVAALILHTDSFYDESDKLTYCLPTHLRNIIADFFKHSVQIIISPEPVVDTKAIVEDPLATYSTTGKHPLKPYRNYIALIYQKMEPPTEQECVEFPIRDVLQEHPPPLRRITKAYSYLGIEKDEAKYRLYKMAIRQALLDRVPDEKASEITTVLVVVGAGRGHLVKTSVQAAKETKRKLKVYAVEGNLSAVGALKELIMSEGMNDIVTIVKSDVQQWDAPETADILVSELLGSFGDNELCPECLDEAQKFLKEDGISIPSSYTSFLQPVTASKLYNKILNDNEVKNDPLLFETGFIVKFHNVARLAPSQPVFTFTHPKQSEKGSNHRHKKLLFVMPDDTGSAMVHGFAGYFDATLYKDVHIVTEPSQALLTTPTWYTMFFPLRAPVCVHPGSTLEVHFWRCCDSAKVWYEWCVTSPCVSPVHNSNGCGLLMELL